LASVGNSKKFSFSRARPSGLFPAKRFGCEDAENSSECMSTASTGSDHSDMCVRMCQSASDSPSLYERIDESSGSDEELVNGRRLGGLWKSLSIRSGGSGKYCSNEMSQGDRLGLDLLESSSEKRFSDHEIWKGCVVNGAKSMRGVRAPMTFWPYWVYQMYDSYALAHNAAGNDSLLSLLSVCSNIYLSPCSWIHSFMLVNMN